MLAAIPMIGLAAAGPQPETVRDDHILSPKFTEWLAAVSEHTAGKPDAEAERISAWTEPELRGVLAELDTLGRALERATSRRRALRPRGTSVDGRLLSTRETVAMLGLAQNGGDLSSLVKRGTLLHSDIAVFLYDQRISPSPSAGDGERAALTVRDGQHRGFARRWPHWDIARELVARRLQDPEDAASARQWYVATAAFMYGRGSLVDLLPHFREAEGLFPAAGDVLFYGALMHAFMASPALQHAARQATLPPDRRPDSASARTHLERARGLLIRALAADAGFVEARVRLGHVLMELKQPREAAAQLRLALAAAVEPPLRYCAELFLGDALAALDDSDGARDAFQRAAALFPHAQSPWLALSRLARSRGDRAGAAAVLDRVLKADPAARRFEDPWWTYHRRGADAPERLLDQWRRTVLASRDAP